MTTVSLETVSLETDILNNFLVISFSMLFCLSSLQSKGKEELGIFFIYGFSLKSARDIFGVYFCEYRYDKHIPNKPASFAYVQF